MGLQDREYYRDEEAAPPGLHFNMRTVVVTMVIINVVLFIINLLSSGWLFQHMHAIPASPTSPRFFWQLLTYGFAHADPLHILLNMFVLWMFGRDFEERRGSTEFVCVYLLALVLGSAFWCARVTYFTPDKLTSLVGASGAVSCILMLYILVDPKRKLLLMMVYPVPAWVVGLVTIVLNIFGNGKHVAYDVHLVGIAFAFAYFYSKMRFERFIPGWVFRTAQNLKPKPSLKVHDPEAHYADLDAEADRILDKVHHEGEGSLSRKERRILKDYSRRMRQKRQ